MKDSDLPCLIRLQVFTNCHSLASEFHEHIGNSFRFQKISDYISTIALSNTAEIELGVWMCFNDAVGSHYHFIESYKRLYRINESSVGLNTFSGAKAPDIHQRHNGRVKCTVRKLVNF